MPSRSARGSRLRPLVLLGGPTASGKTALVLRLAERVAGIEVVSADSQQVYRGFDVGTAKPGAAERARVPHHAIDVREPDEPMDAAAYVRLADAAVEAVLARGGVPVVVGGTGLWMRALVRGLIDVPPVDPELRAELEREAETLGAAVLHSRLSALDPEAARAIATTDAVRIVRALEIARLTGARVSELRQRHRDTPPRYDARWLVVDPGGEVLSARIEQRADQMLGGGLLDEVRGLLARHPRTLRPFGSVGYRQVVEHLLDATPLDATRHAIVRATKGYAKRQRTWFRKEPARWFEPAEALDALEHAVREAWAATLEG